MSANRSREALLDFLRYLADKGLIAKATANARYATASKVLGILLLLQKRKMSPCLPLNDVMSRFQNLEGKGYTRIGSLATYRGRIRSAPDHFENYLKNPLWVQTECKKEGKT